MTFIPSICFIYFGYPGQNRTSFCYANSSGNLKPFMKFLFVRPRFCLRLPSDSTSRWTPLPLANASYCQGAFGTFTLESSPMPGAHIRGCLRRDSLYILRIPELIQKNKKRRLFNDLNHLERHSDYGFIILSGFQHILIVLFVIPVYFNFIFGFMYCFQLFKNVQNTL